MNALKYLLLLTLISWNCSEGGMQELKVEDVIGHYSIEVSGGNQNFEINGTDTKWLPDIGHMTLGPEDSGCNYPVASFKLTFQDPKILQESEDLTLASEGLVDYSFYSILKPCNALGDQKSNWYTFSSIDSAGWNVELGGDSRVYGLTFLRGNFSGEFTRILVNENDVPEKIKVEVKFTAVQ